MGQRAINYDRGVTIKSCDKPTCIQVFMYKDTPGVFLNIYGQPVPDEVAKDAGFDIEALGKAKRLRERMAEAYEEIKSELNMDGGNDSVVKERDGLKIVKYGTHFQVKDANDNVISPIPLPLDQATLLFDKLAPVAEKKPAARDKGRKEPEKE